MLLRVPLIAAHDVRSAQAEAHATKPVSAPARNPKPWSLEIGPWTFPSARLALGRYGRAGEIGAEPLELFVALEVQDDLSASLGRLADVDLRADCRAKFLFQRGHVLISRQPASGLALGTPISWLRIFGRFTTDDR